MRDAAAPFLIPALTRWPCQPLSSACLPSAPPPSCRLPCPPPRGGGELPPPLIIGKCARRGERPSRGGGLLSRRGPAGATVVVSSLSSLFSSLENTARGYSASGVEPCGEERTISCPEAPSSQGLSASRTCRELLWFECVESSRGGGRSKRRDEKIQKQATGSVIKLKVDTQF